MAMVLSQHSSLEKDEKKYNFYTDDELELLYKLENGLVQTKSHEKVMENLRKLLNLDKK